jgi:SAM-dependent methyltransferase
MAAMTENDIALLRMHLIEVVGPAFGPNPESRIGEIRELKRREARLVANALGLGPSDVVMDLGCGMGYGAGLIAPLVRKLYCCDVRETFLGYARAECAGAPNVEFALKPRVGDFTFLEADSLDAVYSAGVFIHLNLFDIHLHFREFARVLKMGGRLFLNIASTDKLFVDSKETTSFLEMVEAYAKNPGTAIGLVQWNSPHAVERIAEHFGFHMTRGKWFYTFRKERIVAQRVVAGATAAQPVDRAGSPTHRTAQLLVQARRGVYRGSA